ncbi:DNA polymerase IV [Thaumasiovibrio subtropicus]|uniref:DNA polymerase IV n=1 Tax=Thaumasiovibrio subtropicus TaxID=1891207 RepID=UPI000B35EBAE|nr:DNA polymerase IV [Thaumasiovibrio subtropicus]
MCNSDLYPSSKKIIHIDMDCFFAAVEMRDNPAYREVPLAIGGPSDRRGVLSTCNYQARRFGVRSAMPTGQAMKLCPDLVVVPGRMEVYRQVSKQIRAIFERYTDKIEPLSLDEAYLDVTDSGLYSGSATLIAKAIRENIYDELALTASAGVAPVKFIAKIASDLNKPNGMYIVTPEEVGAFVERLALSKIPGVGKVTIRKLHAMGLRCGADVQEYGRDNLVMQLGKFGESLWERAHGIDTRDVVTVRDPKSVGIERTFSKNICSFDECWAFIEGHFAELERRLAPKLVDRTITKLGVKMKFADFQQTTVEHHYTQLELEPFRHLLSQAIARQHQREIRLLGIFAGLKPKADAEQLMLSL